MKNLLIILLVSTTLYACQKDVTPAPPKKSPISQITSALSDHGLEQVDHEGKTIILDSTTIENIIRDSTAVRKKLKEKRKQLKSFMFYDYPECEPVGDTCELVYFPDHNRYHLERIDLGPQQLTHYKTAHLLSLIGEFGSTTGLFVSWDIDRNGIVGLEDLMILLAGFGGEPLSGFNLDSCVVNLSGFSSGIECDYNGTATMEPFDFSWQQTDPDLHLYVFRTSGDEVEDYTTPGVYNDEILNSVKVELPVGFPGATYWFRRY